MTYCVAIDRAAYNQGQNAKYDMSIDDTGKAQTILARGPGGVCYALRTGGFFGVSEDMAQTILSRDYKDATAVCYSVDLVPCDIILRRLTPTECARLQGMPDWWCDDVLHADSAEYKMWGNGMALPNVLYVLEGIVEAVKGERNDKQRKAHCIADREGREG